MNQLQISPVRSEKRIFFEALEKTTSAERAAYLDGVCGTDPGLRARVQALLASHFSQDSFMEQAVVANGPTVGATMLLPITEKPGDRIGRYKLIEQIGEGGGCGVVYMAEQEVPVRRRVALKVIKLGMDTKYDGGWRTDDDRPASTGRAAKTVAVDPRRSGLDGDEVSGEGSYPPLRNGQRSERGPRTSFDQ